MYVHGMIGELSTSSHMPYARILYRVKLPSLAARRIQQSSSIPPWSDQALSFHPDVVFWTRAANLEPTSPACLHYDGTSIASLHGEPEGLRAFERR